MLAENIDFDEGCLHSDNATRPKLFRLCSAKDLQEMLGCGQTVTASIIDTPSFPKPILITGLKRWYVNEINVWVKMQKRAE
jgi:predicted DNA-binding transcriptional regulator AlpA